MPADVPAANDPSRIYLLALGLLVAAVIGFVTVLSRLPIDPARIAAGQTATAPDTPGAVKVFDFYRVLDGTAESTESEAPGSVDVQEAVARHRPATRVVPGRAQHTRLNAAGSGAGGTIYPGEQYYLQAGVFTELEAAEQRRAAMLLLGLDAFIVTRQEPGGTLGHRVRIGPFRDLTGLSEARQRLHREMLDYDIIRVSG